MADRTADTPTIPFAARVRDLHLTRRDTHILRGLTCDIPAGQCTAILGPNGCGKTTFTRCLTGQMYITSGSVEVLSSRLGQTDVRALRKRIGIVNPTTDMAGIHMSGAVVDADLTAHDAVCTGFFGTVGLYDVPTDHQHRLADQLLDQVGLAHRRQLRFALLSTGEQRRALIARALVNHPDLLILDEPTAGLDIAGRERVLATVEQFLARDNPPTILMITHHVEELSPRTAQVLLMREGQFIARGRPEQVITPESLSDTFGCKVFVRRIHGRFWLEVLPEAWLDLI